MSLLSIRTWLIPPLSSIYRRPHIPHQPFFHSTDHPTSICLQSQNLSLLERRVPPKFSFRLPNTTVSLRLLATCAAVFAAPLALAFNPIEVPDTLRRLTGNFDVLVPSLEDEAFDTELLQDINLEFSNIILTAEPTAEGLKANPEPLQDLAIAYSIYLAFQPFTRAQTSLLNALTSRAKRGDFAASRNQASQFAVSLRAVKATITDLTSGITNIEYAAVQPEITKLSKPLQSRLGFTTMLSRPSTAPPRTARSGVRPAPQEQRLARS
jgi:hypothetical protein